jgi:tetratricopeptide (TPR) repeat protein
MEMSPEKWERVKELLEAALELNPEEVRTFLDRIHPDEDVRRELERLLSYRTEVAGFLSFPAPQQLTNPPVPHRLKAGTILGNRFRIVRFVAAGGMGEVYEAEDQELRETVGIKTIRHDLASQPHFLQNFRREVHLAKQVTHPNVCRIYDFFRHTDPGDACVFVSMEFLRGETLAERLKCTGRMTIQDALPIIVQMAEALNAAHAAKILHRDFKPGNVIMVSSSSVKAVRAVVTDFGLAFQPTEHNASATLSASRGVLGTPAYMSPEQIEGRELTEASDIYALGLVMYEIVTGRTPFNESTQLLSVMKRLYELPVRPRIYCPDLDRTLEKVIVQCLEREPVKRPQTVAKIIEAIRGITLPGFAPLKRKPAKSGIVLWVAAVVVSVSLAIIGPIYYFHFRRLQKVTEKDTVVLADFTNKTGDTVWDDTLKQGLRVELEQSPYLNIESDEKVVQVIRYMGRPADARVTEEVAREVCRRVGSKAILLGSISSIGSHYVIGLGAVNCQSDDSLASLQIEATNREGVLTKLHAIGTEMRMKLGESLASVERYDVPVQATTSSLEALQAYGAALRTKRSQGDSSALPLLKRAVELDPDMAMAYVVLGAVYSNLDETALASESAKKAYKLRDRVGERERLYIDSSYYNLATGQLDKEIAVYTQWQQTYPRDWVPRHKLAYCEGYLGHYQKALEGYREVLRLDPGDVINYLDLASTYINLDQLDEAKAVLEEAQRRKLEHEYLPQVHYLLAFLRNDASEMSKWTLPASWMPGTEDILLSSESDTEAFHGRIRNARDLSRRAIESARQSDVKGRAAFWQAHWALWEADVGNLSEARRQAGAALALDSGEDVQEVAALALARSGEVVRARALAENLGSRFPTHLWLKRYWLPCIRAAIEISHRNPVGAVNALQVTGKYELGGDPITLDTLYPVYLRGQAYLMQWQGEKASAEFQKILDHPGRIGNSPLGALAHLQFARACGLSAETARAKREYQEFLKLWKDADPDISLRREAEIEYAKLR